MKYKLFGNSGLRVSELAMGAMTFGTESGYGVEKDEARKVYEAYREAGGNIVDTANVYCRGTSESFLGEFMAGDRERVVISTKYSGPMRDKDYNAAGNSRKNMMDAIEGSLRRLRTDYVDIYWQHVWDTRTPLEEVMRGFDDLVRQGKVLYIGVSCTPAWAATRMHTIAEMRGWAKFIGVQLRYSLIDRSAERELLPMARALDLGVLTFAANGQGILTGKYNLDPKATGRVGDMTPDRLTERNLGLARAVMEVADELGCKPSQVALAWAKRGPANIIPLIGARTGEHMKENLGCLDVELPDEAMKKLNEISAISPGFPHDIAGNRPTPWLINHRKWRSGGYLDN